MFRLSPVFTVLISHLRKIEETRKSLLSSLRHIDRRFRRKFHDLVDACHMVILDMVDDHVLDGLRVDQLGYVLDRDIGKVVLDRVDQGRLFVDNQIVVVACAPGCLVSVKIPYRPIDCANPIDTVLYFDRLHARHSLHQQSPRSSVRYRLPFQPSVSAGSIPRNRAAPWSAFSATISGTS